MIKQLFKTMVALLAIAAAATGPARAQSNTVRWDNNDMSNFYISSQGDRETIDDVTLTSNGGTAGDNGSIYFNGAFTFSVPPGSVFTQIVIRDDTWLGVDGWSVDEPQTQATWTGSARSVSCQISASQVQYIEFTIAPAVPQMYTSEVSITDLVPGDTLAEGATIIGSGNDLDMVFLAFNRAKENGVVPQYWTNLYLPPTVIGTNGTISKTNTYTPVDENGQDGNAWVVTSAEINYNDGFEVGLAGITIPVLYNVTFAEGTEDVGNWTITPAAATTGVEEGTVVTVKYNGTRRINSIELKSKMLTSPLTMEAITAGTVKVQSPQSGMQYTLNGGAKTAVTSAAITVAAGDKVAFYGDSTNITSYFGTKIYGGTANVKVYGNIMSLVNEEHFDTATTLTANFAFFELFRENAKLSDASGLLLPATTLTERCYMDMFLSCVNLTTAPAKLPATTLTGNCYAYMFQGCTSLTTAPELPAPVLAPSCYYSMFSNCTNLNSVTCLATDISASSCTGSWLDGAGSAVQGTMTFNAASSANWPTNSVSGIPSGWTLVTPAHTPLTLEALTDGTVKVQNPQSGMQYTLNGGAKTPVTSAAIDVVAGDKVVFYGNGTSITSYDGTRIAGGDADVKVYGNIMSLVDEENFATATTLSVQNQFNNLFEENNHLKDASGLLLPATTLAPTCYAYMFHYCSSLTAAPAVLPATTLASNCYRGMFLDCSSLTTAPELPAQTLVSDCYSHMFQLCTKLNSVTCLATSGINQNGSTESWLDNAGTDQSVTTKTFNAASSAEWPTSVSGIPEGWTLGAQSTPEPVTLVPTGNTNEWTLTMPADNMLLMVNYYGEYTLDSIPLDWQVKVGNAAPVHPTAYTEGNTTLGHLTITETDSVTLIPDNPRRVKSVTLEDPVVLVNIDGITLDITGCTTWAQIIARNPSVIMDSGGYILSEQGVLVLAGSVFTDDPYDPAQQSNYHWQLP